MLLKKNTKSKKRKRWKTKEIAESAKDITVIVVTPEFFEWITKSVYLQTF